MEKLSRIIRSHELTAYCGLQRTQIDFLISRGDFPKPIKLSARRKGWLESELLEWQAARIAKRDGGDLQHIKGKAQPTRVGGGQDD